MSYDLCALKKGAYDTRVGAFSWPMILNETGACYLLRYGDHTAKPGQYYYCPDNNTGSPISNDGFKVLASEAKAMAKIFRGYVFIKRALREDWNKMPEIEQSFILELNKRAEPPHEDFLEKIEKLAEFCEQSGGFRIR